MFILPLNDKAGSLSWSMTHALNKVASRFLLLHPETSTVRIPMEKTRYTKHERTPIYFHHREGGQTESVWRGDRGCDGRSKCWLHEHDMTQKTRTRFVHAIYTCAATDGQTHYKRCQKLIKPTLH